MARFRKKRSSSRRYFGRSSRRSRGSSSSGLKMTDVILAGAVYGAARPFVANIIPPMFEFGPVDSDNVIIGGAAFLGMKQKNKMIKAISTVALASEVALVTSKMMSGGMGGSNNVQY